MNRFDEFCERHRDRLVRRLERRCGDDAEDVAHQALLRVWKRFDSIAPGAEWVYVLTTAHNIANTMYQRARSTEVLDEAKDARHSGPSAEQELLAKDFNAGFAAAMKELPPLTQHALVLRRRGFSSKQIAEHLGINSDQAVRTRLSRAYEALAKSLGTPPDGVPWSQLLGDDQ